MPAEYSVEVCKKLEDRFQTAQLHRPMRISRYDAGTELVYEVVGVDPVRESRAKEKTKNKELSNGVEEVCAARVKLVIEDFVGGGFAGQVYKVKIQEIEANNGPIAGLEAGKVYAMKILIPPSGFARLFRNALYRIGFQGAFAPQVNPSAARAGALWQKFIRRGAKIKFGDEKAVVDIYATFVDKTVGSCGELSEWIDGRTWRLEVDEHIDLLSRWRRGKEVDQQQLGSPEYRAKRQFMSDFVGLLHDMGAYELARQYEWSTCKSQPNILKRKGPLLPQGQACPRESGDLVAVDFRPGLALLPFLPMSPGDFKLIVKGVMRGSLVQFDRGDVNKLQSFVESHGDEFANMNKMLDEIREAEQIYRNSLPDITHNHVRLFYSRKLWSTILDSAIVGWRVRNLVDEQSEQKLHKSSRLTLLFLLIGLLPFLGKIILRIWGRAYWRRHYWAMLTNWDYLRRAIYARIAEKVIIWHRKGRVGPERALKLQKHLWRFICHLPLSVLPAGLHRFLTDRDFRKDKLIYIFVRPIRLYFNAQLREQWLREMVAEGQKKHMLSDEDAGLIFSKIKEPFIQRYLISLVVHLLTLPVTQVVSVSLAIIYVLMHPEMPRAQAWGIGVGIIALFQVVPVSPGSFCRGLWAVGIAFYDRSFKDYNIAVFLSFFKYIGYLAFPIQMTYHYPVLARFMSAYWATEVVHIVPVFGERGALLEHWVFCLFYNWPLTIWCRMRRRAEIRAKIAPRYWHIWLCVFAAIFILGTADYIYLKNIGDIPGLKDIWWLAILVPLFCGAGVTLGCGGAALGKRIVASIITGVIVAILYAAMSCLLGWSEGVTIGEIARYGLWRIFIFTILSALGTILTELKLPEPASR